MINKVSDLDRKTWTNAWKLRRNTAPDSRLAQTLILQALEDAFGGDDEARAFFRDSDFLYWSRIAGLDLKARAKLALLAQDYKSMENLGSSGLKTYNT